MAENEVNKEEEMDFDSLDVVEPEKVESAGEAPAVPAKVEGAVKEPTKELFSFDSLASLPGVVVGDVGLEISRFPVEKARFTTSSRSLISIVSGHVVAIKTHYNEDLGNYICFGGKCCEQDGLARVRYLFPVVMYDTDKRGRPVSKEVTFKTLVLGKDAYDDIRTIIELNGDITKLDLLVTCKDEQYQKVSLATAGSARWRKDREVAKQVVTFWREHIKDMIIPVARVMTPEEFDKRVAAELAIENTAGDDVDFDKMFDE